VALRVARIIAAVLILIAALHASGAAAFEAVSIRPDIDALDLTDAADLMQTDRDRVQISALPGRDGIVRRMEVRAREGNMSWAVLALANNTDEQVDRLLLTPRYNLLGLGLLFPTLAEVNVVGVTPSSGDSPDHVLTATANAYHLTIDPGTVVTYAIELRSGRLPSLYLWNVDAFYRTEAADLIWLYQAAVGIAGLLIVFIAVLLFALWRKRLWGT
jgi:hypothetical protein